MSKIVGITVGTPLSPRSIKEKLKVVTSVNGTQPDERGNVEIDIEVPDVVPAVQEALTEAKESGEFKGEKGDAGEQGPQGIQGPQGPQGTDGKNGTDGYSPVRGVDYWTDADKAEIKAYVDEAILGGEW